LNLYLSKGISKKGLKSLKCVITVYPIRFNSLSFF
jgi:hypothetical protein